MESQFRIGKRKRIDLEVQQKQKIIKFCQDNPKLSKVEVIRHFKNEWKIEIGKSTLYDLLKNNDLQDDNVIGSPAAKRMRSGAFPLLEKALYMWYSEKKAKNIPVNDAIMKEYAMKFSDMMGYSNGNESTNFKFSNGWLEGFKSRYNLKAYTISGESGAVDKIQVDKGRETLKKLLIDYNKDDIYNFDETALFYRMLPNKTLASAPVSGAKVCKERISVGLCSNATGKDKFKPVVIGKFKNPRCFAAFDPSRFCVYKNNCKAWMTGEIFDEWLESFNSKMKLQKRNVILLIDNASSHTNESKSNVKIHYLPPNTTSILQPMDAGIIWSFKTAYKKILLKHYINLLDHDRAMEPPNLKEAIMYLQQAWQSVSISTIVNCWYHCDIFPEVQKVQVDVCRKESDANIDLIKNGLKKWFEKFKFDENEYLSFDSTLSSGETLALNDIVDLVKSTENPEIENEVDDDTPAVKVYRFCDVLNAMDVVKSYLSNHQSFDVDDSNLLLKLEERLIYISAQNKKQTTLDNFLN
jgi:hypothetical protein